MWHFVGVRVSVVEVEYDDGDDDGDGAHDHDAREVHACNEQTPSNDMCCVLQTELLSY